MATIRNTIGFGGTTRDFSTVALWEASLPASTIVAGNVYFGDMYNDSEFDATHGSVTFASHTTNATFPITLEAASGQSFSDNTNVRTNALKYNSANGVAINDATGYAAT